MGTTPSPGAEMRLDPRFCFRVKAVAPGDGSGVVVLDETRNYGETDREFLLRAEAEVVFGRDRRRCCPTARLCDSYKRRRLTPAPRTHRPAPPDRERNSGAPIAVAHLVPTYDRGPRRPRRWSTWLLLSPKSRRRRRRSGLDDGRLDDGVVQAGNARPARPWARARGSGPRSCALREPSRGPRPVSNEATAVAARGERSCLQRRLPLGYSRFGRARPGRAQIGSGCCPGGGGSLD